MNEQPRRGVVILIRRGDPEITEPIADTLVRGRGDGKGPSTALMTTGARPTGNALPRMDCGEALRRVAIRRHTPEELEAMIAKAQYDYGQDPPLPRWAEWIVIGWALLCEGIRRAYRAQEKVLR